MLNKNILEKFFYSSGIKKILGIKQTSDIINFVFEEKNFLFIILKLNLRQKKFIIKNKKIFIEKLNTFLFLYNMDYKNYQNIGINKIEINNNLFGNTIILGNIKKNITGYIPIKNLGLKYDKNGLLLNFYLLDNGNIPKIDKKPSESEKKVLYYDIILNLLRNKNFSVRKMREAGIDTQKSLIINNYIKKLKIFEVDILDNKKKNYFLERLYLIDKDIINNF